jgi:hypothetical protein
MTYKSGETPPAGITFMPSKNVSLGYESGNLGGTDMVVFSIASKNSAGDRIFGATSSSSAVAQAVSSAGYVLEAGKNPTLPTTASDSTITGGVGNWSIL